MSHTSYLAFGIVIMAVITYGLRALPFVAMRGLREHPVLRELASTMPLGVMLILVVYSLMDLRFDSVAGWLPAVLGTATALGTYLWRRSVALSIIAAVAIYGGALYFYT